MHSPSRSHQQQPQSSTSAGNASPIFVDNQGQPLQICISRTVRDRSTLESKIKLHGGVVTQNERVAYIRLADPGHNYQGRLFSTTWVDRCIQEQQLLKHNEPEFQLGVGVSTGRVPFTAEESETLREFVRAKKAQGIPIGGDNIYQEFAEMHPRHSWQSWKNHAVKVLGLTKETVSPYEANKARRNNARVESLKAREVMIQGDRSDNTTSTADNTSTSIQHTADRPLQVEPNNDESPADQHADDGQPQVETDRAKTPAFQTQPTSQGSPMVFSEIASDEDDAMHKEEVNELNRRRASYGTSQQSLLQLNASSAVDLPHHAITESGEIELLDEDDLMIEKSILEKMSRSSMVKPPELQVQQILSQEQQGIQDSQEHDPYHLGPFPWTEPDAPPVTEILSCSSYDIPEKFFTDPSTSKKRTKVNRTRSIGSSPVGSSSRIGQTGTKRTTDEPISRLAKEKATARTFDQHDHRGASHEPPSAEIAAESRESNSPIRITRRSGSPRHEEAESSTAITTAPRNSIPVRRIQPAQQNANETAPLRHMNPSEQSDTICNTDPPMKAASGYRDTAAQRPAQEGDVGYSKPIYARGAVPGYYKAGPCNPQTPEEEEACKLLLYLSELYQGKIRYLKLEELILPLTAIDLLDACSGNVDHVMALIHFGMDGKLAQHFWSRDEDKVVFTDDREAMALLVIRHGYEAVSERRAYLVETRRRAKNLTLSPGALENLEAMGQLKRAGPRCGSTPQPKRPRLEEE
ncbi:MAG: hypothetical protein J3Q66DRAFT_389527 [Benniella sp.]|nr:MAG: hypothetical protein J3Q66DRAFT_389527 [Benniella sp.]